MLPPEAKPPMPSESTPGAARDRLAVIVALFFAFSSRLKRRVAGCGIPAYFRILLLLCAVSLFGSLARGQILKVFLPFTERRIAVENGDVLNSIKRKQSDWLRP